MATTAMTKQQTTLADANVSTMTDQGINLFGLNKESDQFKELSSLSTQIDFNSTDEEVKQKNLQYANLVIDYLLPSFSATTFDKNRYASSEEDQLSSVFRNFSEAGDLESLRNIKVLISHLYFLFHEKHYLQSTFIQRKILAKKI